MTHHEVAMQEGKSPTRVAVEAAVALGYPKGSRVVNPRLVSDDTTSTRMVAFDVERPEDKRWPPGDIETKHQ